MVKMINLKTAKSNDYARYALLSWIAASIEDTIESKACNYIINNFILEAYNTTELQEILYSLFNDTWPSAC